MDSHIRTPAFCLWPGFFAGSAAVHTLTPAGVPTKTLLLLVKGSTGYSWFPLFCKLSPFLTPGCKVRRASCLSFPPFSPALVVPICSPLDASMYRSLSHVFVEQGILCWNIANKFVKISGRDAKRISHIAIPMMSLLYVNKLKKHVLDLLCD